jgi:hypothetical protein
VIPLEGGFRVPPFPRPARIGLGAWQQAARLGIGRPSLAEANLVAAARKRSGLHDFGPSRPLCPESAPVSSDVFGSFDFRLPLRRLLRSFEEEAGLHLLGRAVLRSSVIRALECRLRLQHLCDLHTEIDDQPVRAPIFITGMQRTGTTLLHRLLSCAPALRHLTAVEALNPAPLGRPIRDDPDEFARRVRVARTAERGMKYMSPALFAIHPIEAESPEEDVFLFDPTFISPAVDASLHVASYTKWIREIDQKPAYDYFRRLIQLLLWQKPGRYLGKTPHHQENLDVLFEVFPDAKVIHTHRDPIEVVPSFSSMMVHAGSLLANDIAPRTVGRRVTDQMVNSVERAILARQQAPAGSVLDVHYVRLVADPMAEMHRIFEFAELEWEPGTISKMEAWLGANSQHKYGVHRYRLGDFGLDAGDLNRRFKRYRETFDVAAAD